MKRKKSKKSNSKFEKDLKNKTILITGGAGSVGTVLTKRILSYSVKSVRVLDIDEHALFKLGREVKNPKLRLLLGSILDKDRVNMAANNVDIIIHCAAIKNIEISEYNPIETINTNVNGTVNLIKAAINNAPIKFINISTDKAAEPSTLYGTTKQLSEKTITWAGNYISNAKFATVRLGNIFETRGNVMEVWRKEKKENLPLSITDPLMKRYFFHVDEAVSFILNCLPMIKAGEIFIPKMKLYKIKDLADKFSKKQKIIGLRQGEKFEEVLLSKSEKERAIEKSDLWIINPEKTIKSVNFS
ncbi:MAG: hypothetical protein CXT78_00915 [Thaumarchaeota archaeon]|nr:MAG: hypothetical protein CXT78_00915 [Nitrososphaerota archaeon]